MPELAPDLVISTVTAPLVVGCGTVFNVDVTVTAGDEEFENGVAYRLFVLVNGLPLGIKTGNVQDSSWPAATSTISVPFTAGPLCPAIYSVTAFLLEGPRGIPDADDAPSVAIGNPILAL